MLLLSKEDLFWFKKVVRLKDQIAARLSLQALEKRCHSHI